MAQDHFAFHHPVPVQTGDKFGNVRKTVGGNVWYNVVDDARADTSWDIINHQLDVDTSWDILNDLLTDSSWDILNDETQDFSWAILSEYLVQTSWHIHPAIIEFIQQYLVKYIRTEFDIRKVETGFELAPIKIQSNFTVNQVIEETVQLVPMTWPSFDIKPIQTNFSLRQPITKNFVVTRVNNKTRTP